MARQGTSQGEETEREIRKELIAPWGERPISSITREDVVTLVEAIARRPAPYSRPHRSWPRSFIVQLGDQSRHLRTRSISPATE